MTLVDAWAVGTNLLIAFGYLGIGLYVAPRFRFGRQPTTGAQLAKWSGITFFVTCALTHIDLAYHAGTNTMVDFGVWHHLLICTIQALSAPSFLLFASIFLNIRIEGKRV